MYPVKTLGLCVNVEPSTVSYARHNMSGNVMYLASSRPVRCTKGFFTIYKATVIYLFLLSPN